MSGASNDGDKVGATSGAAPKTSSRRGLAVALGLSLLFAMIVAFAVHMSGGTSPCSNDWKKCADNQQFVEDSGLWVEIGSACQIAADQLARHGALKWPWFSFASYRSGDSYVKTGILVAIEPDAQFQNGFGAMAHSTVVCEYDLRTEEVISVNIVPH